MKSGNRPDILFVLGIGAGWIATLLSRKDMTLPTRLEDAYDLHAPDGHGAEHGAARHFGWKRILLFLGVAVFIAALVLLAMLVGLIPESGPHMVFVTLFAGGVIPFPVLLANSIVQDGHASLPLLADSKVSWLRAKALKIALALPVSLLALTLQI